VSLVLLGFLGPTLVLALIVLGIAALAGGRGDNDPDGRRPYALYLAGVAFLTLVTSLGAFGVIASATVDAVHNGDSGPALSEDIEVGGQFGSSVTLGSSSSKDERTRTAVAGLIALGLALPLAWWHQDRLRRLATDPATTGTAAWRTAQSYLYGVCFVTMLVALGAAAAAAYAVFSAIAPGISGIGKRSNGVADAATALLLGGAAVALFAFHWRQGDRRGLRAPVAVAASPPVPPMPEPIDLDERPARQRPLRKRPE
jgi:hypothetical protein